MSGCTVPPHSGVRHATIRIGSGDSGYVVTLIPQSNSAPHQVVGKMVYYIRAGSDFVPAPHGLLAGLFGRRPQARVCHQYITGPARLERGVVHIQVGLALCNQGPGIASDLFANVLVMSAPGIQCQLAFEQTDPANWTGVWSFGRHMSLICRPDLRLPPEARVQPLVMNLQIAPPFDSPIEIKGMVGCGTGPPYRFKLFNTAPNVARLYGAFIQQANSGGDMARETKGFPAKLLGMDDHEELTTS